MSDERLLAFRGVRKAFSGGEPVLRGFDAEVPLEGVTYVVGKSGGGKSSLLRLAAGLLRPDEGEVFLFGEAVHLLPERDLERLRSRAPYLVQVPALLDWLTVEENVAVAVRRARDRRARAREALARVGLAGEGHLLPAALGPAAQKRAAIARALVLDPEFLLLDEPTTGLDPHAAEQVNQVIATLRRQGLGALVVSHDYRALEEVADRVLLVAEGRAAFLGPPARFVASDLPEVQALLAPSGTTRR